MSRCQPLPFFTAIDETAIMVYRFEITIDRLGTEEAITGMIVDRLIPALRGAVWEFGHNPCRIISVMGYVFQLRRRGLFRLAERLENVLNFFGPITYPEFYIRAIENTPQEKLSEFVGNLAKFLKALIKGHGIAEIAPIIVASSGAILEKSQQAFKEFCNLLLPED